MIIPAYAVAKRATDIIVSAIAIVVLSPVMLTLAVLIWATIGRPVFFRQQRLGYRGRPFGIIKFRTMHDARDAHGAPRPDHERLTRFGRWLRSLTLDELPELFNVLRGEMSLVGPRPLLPEYWDRYTSEERRRHDCLPGMTGWAVVHGRNALPWEQKFELDLWYVDHRSLWLDLRILARTAVLVLRRHGVAQPGHATAEMFQGERR